MQSEECHWQITIDMIMLWKNKALFWTGSAWVVQLFRVKHQNIFLKHKYNTNNYKILQNILFSSQLEHNFIKRMVNRKLFMIGRIAIAWIALFIALIHPFSSLPCGGPLCCCSWRVHVLLLLHTCHVFAASGL